jgi:hypothetical protein
MTMTSRSKRYRVYIDEDTKRAVKQFAIYYGVPQERILRHMASYFVARFLDDPQKAFPKVDMETEFRPWGRPRTENSKKRREKRRFTIGGHSLEEEAEQEKARGRW